MQNNLVVGYRRFVSKAGDDTLIIDVIKDATDWDIKGGRVGQKVDGVFIPSSLFNKVSPDVIGKILVVHGEPNGRFFNINDIEFV